MLVAVVNVDRGWLILDRSVVESRELHLDLRRRRQCHRLPTIAVHCFHLVS